jgi:hypothetical protein
MDTKILLLPGLGTLLRTLKTGPKLRFIIICIFLDKEAFFETTLDNQLCFKIGISDYVVLQKLEAS